MNLRKVIAVLMIAMCTCTIMPAFAGNEISTVPPEKTAQDSRSQQLTNRLIEIKNMDKSNLTSEQKRELRKEVKAIKRDNRRGSGIYLSVGAVIIIVLLLILLL